MRRFALVCLVLIALICVLIPLRATADQPTPTPTWEPTPGDALGPFNFPAGVNPLTGLKVDDPAVLTRRPLAVKISNAPALVRPQAGISQADLVFEHITE